ncbi:hypothetical protein BN6_80950 [Saccharothrix espanaensis DSM 44229]|uniref:Uncharacterized protein n=1 Tax=Saccharothrix espanaensis (strain ATCC 51144 / DSM 44229 / JCM 9112 / NBRC 15066 / NRRL 15764) TaxID=1179773 RepID=K0KCN7_SACES|nr:hypothetical protein BN6_80950 [Saccharothrix espanaensis DSM 44229]
MRATPTTGLAALETALRGALDVEAGLVTIVGFASGPSVLRGADAVRCRAVRGGAWR